MIVAKVKQKLPDKEAKIINLVKTDRLKIRYSKVLNALVVIMELTKYKSLTVQILSYWPFGIEQGHIDLGFNIWYRLKNVDHLGCDIELNLIFMTINIEFSDWRHLEDYENI